MKQSLCDLWNKVRSSIVCAVEIPVGKERVSEKGPEKKIEEKMAEMFPKSVKHEFTNSET